MEQHLTYLAALTAVYAGFLIWAALNGRQHMKEDFMSGHRVIGPWSTAASICAGLRDGAGNVFWISIAAAVGFGAYWVLGGVLFGILLLATVAKKARQHAQKTKVFTVGDMIGQQSGIWSNRIAGFIILVAAFFYASGNLHIVGVLGAQLLDLSKDATIIATATVIAAYLVVGGYTTLIRTDTIQWVIIALAMLIPLGLFDWPSWEVTTAEITNRQTISNFSPLVLLVIFWVLTAPDNWQRVFSAKSPQSASRGFLYAIPMYALTMTGLLVMGMWLRQISPAEVPNDELYYHIFTNAALSPVFFAFLALHALTAAMSTLDSQVYLITSSLVRNLVGEKHKNKAVQLNRYTIIAALALMVFVATQISNIIDHLVGLSSMFIVLFPAVSLFILDISLKKYDKLVAPVLLLGAAAHVACYFNGVFANVLMIMAPMAGVGVCLAVLYLFSRKTT